MNNPVIMMEDFLGYRDGADDYCPCGCGRKLNEDFFDYESGMNEDDFDK